VLGKKQPHVAKPSPILQKNLAEQPAPTTDLSRNPCVYKNTTYTPKREREPDQRVNSKLTVNLLENFGLMDTIEVNRRYSGSLGGDLFQSFRIVDFFPMVGCV